jgi:Zn-dependent protease
MAVTGMEWLILGFLVLLVIILKPNSLVSLARSFGQGVTEFKKASRARRVLAGDYVLLDMARRLGIVTEGKPSIKISEEILAKAGHDQH